MRFPSCKLNGKIVRCGLHYVLIHFDFECFSSYQPRSIKCLQLDTLLYLKMQKMKPYVADIVDIEREYSFPSVRCKHLKQSGKNNTYTHLCRYKSVQYKILVYFSDL